MIEPIANYTTTGTAAGVTFSSIPQTYKHLMLVTNIKSSTSFTDIGVQVNGDSASNYSYGMMWANGQSGTSAGNYRTGGTRFQISDWSYADSTVFNNCIAYFHNYTNTNLWKVVNFKSVRGNSTGGVDVGQSYWRSTSAINSMYIFGTNQSFATGSTFSLYGII